MSIEIPVIKSPKAFRPMREANELLGDRDALWAQFERDGYLFFRNVLDGEAVRELRDEYARILSKQGLVGEGDDQLRFTGVDLSHVRRAGGALLPVDDLHLTEAWCPFVMKPQIQEFFAEITGEELQWLPMNEYKAVPPAERGDTRFNFVHQDSFYNKGIRFVTVWVPISPIEPECGGIAVAEGMHHQWYHRPDAPPAYFVPEGAIPDEAWVSTAYRPGDVLLMHETLPHSGLTNHSDRFRLSMDVRFVRASQATTVVGKAVTANTDRIVVEDPKGQVYEFALDDATDFRNWGLGLVTRADAAELYQPGDDVIVAFEGDRATSVRRTSAAAYRKEMASV